MIFQILCFALPSILLLKLYQCDSLFQKQFLLSGLILTIAVSLGLVVGVNAIVNALKDISNLPQDYENTVRTQLLRINQPYGLALDLFTVALIPAICEELFFRGFVLTALSQKLKPHMALLLSSLIFAVFHINPIFIAFYMVLGLGFGWLFLRFRNLGLTMIAHFINNSLGVIVYHFMDPM